MIVDDKSPMSSCRLVTSFAKGNKLGEGTYGSVYEARDKDSGALVALKRVKEKSEAYDREGIPTTSLREVALLKAAVTSQHRHAFGSRGRHPRR